MNGITLNDVIGLVTAIGVLITALSGLIGALAASKIIDSNAVKKFQSLIASGMKVVDAVRKVPISEDHPVVAEAKQKEVEKG